MEGDYQSRVDLSRAADELSILSRIEHVRIQIDESRDELETMRLDPSVSEKDIELLQDCLNINLELLGLIEKADEYFYDELSAF